jgi:uncharacterized protein YndB with AHSA1/START domain
MISPATGSLLTITRRFDAPRARVYAAFFEPELFASWFGPEGHSVPLETVEIDARVGGRQRFVLVNEESPAWTSPVDATYTLLVENEVIVSEEEWDADVPGLGLTTARMTLRIELHAERGGTRLELEQGPHGDDMLPLARAGWESSFRKLDRLLAS